MGNETLPSHSDATALVACVDRRVSGPSKGALCMLFVAWIGAIAAGSVWMWRYELAPSQPTRAPMAWPAGVAILRGEDHTLVVAVHPQCPCTRATIAELDRLTARLRGRLRVHVLVLRPEGAVKDFEKTDLWDDAARIRSVRMHIDRGGQLADRFGAMSSGTAILFDGGGRRVFQGGITPSRGHEGESVGKRRIIELVENGSSDRDASAVFGCALFDPSSQR